jgi:hypothetical protein
MAEVFTFGNQAGVSEVSLINNLALKGEVCCSLVVVTFGV